MTEKITYLFTHIPFQNCYKIPHYMTSCLCCALSEAFV